METEAYGGLEGLDDAASHAYRGTTNRNRVMFGTAGMSYVYFIYGMYHCFNIVTEKRGIGAAVLIRALEPVEGIELMRRRRRKQRPIDLTNGPGKLCMAMNIHRRHNGIDLTGNRIFVLNDNQKINTIQESTRVGIRHARDKLWRFFIADNPYVSKSSKMTTK